MKRLVAAIVLSILALPAAAECFNRDHLAAYLKVKYELSLRAWGLDDAGNMVELFYNDGGNWAVIETTPSRCAKVAMPHKEGGRLVEIAPPNYITPLPQYLSQGSAL